MHNIIARLVVIASLTLSSILILVSCNEGSSFTETRPRMGHLARLVDGKGNDLFRLYFGMYFEKIIAKGYGKYKLNKNDWRTYSPRSEECSRFLKSFVANNYVLINMQDFVLLDACLGYLYDDNNYKWQDNEANEVGKYIIEDLIRDEKLRSIYHNTDIESIDLNGASVLKKTFETFFYLLDKDYYYITCDKSWINMLVDFAEGRNHLNHNVRRLEQDSYLNLLFDAVSRLGAKCFKQAVEKVSSDMQYILKDSAMNEPQSKSGITKTSEALKQQLDNRWPRKLLQVLQVAQGLNSSNSVDLVKLQQLGVGLTIADPNAQERFLGNLKQYANNISKSTDNLPVDKSSYDNIKDDLCKYYKSDNVLGHDTWAELVKMLRHQDFYGHLDEVLFYDNEQQDNIRAQRVKPVYMATFFCRYINLTYADVVSTRPGELTYKIVLPRDAHMLMHDWIMSKHDDLEHATPTPEYESDNFKAIV